MPKFRSKTLGISWFLSPVSSSMSSSFAEPLPSDLTFPFSPSSLWFRSSSFPGCPFIIFLFSFFFFFFSHLISLCQSLSDNNIPTRYSFPNRFNAIIHMLKSFEWLPIALQVKDKHLMFKGCSQSNPTFYF